MSAMLLQYPKKPNGVADDMESFLYLFVRFAGRFLHTTHSDLKHSHEDKSDALLKHNQKHELMTSFVANFFNEEFKRDGYTMGGFQKRSSIRACAPPFTLLAMADSEEHAFTVLLRDFYKLVHEHYSAIDMAKYESYRPAIRRIKSLPQGKKKIPRAASARQESLIAANPLLASSPISVAHTPTQEYKPVLDTHDAVDLLLTRIFLGKSAPCVFPECDKTVDQFYGIGHAAMAVAKSASGSGLKHSGSRPSVSEGSASKKAKLTR